MKYKINYKLNGGTSNIPKIIHQLWIGEHKVPWRYINTWKNDYIKKNPDWKYILWTEKPYLKLDEFKKLDYTELLSKINNTKVTNKFTHCGNTYNIEDIFGKKDGKNSKRCIDTLKELI